MKPILLFFLLLSAPVFCIPITVRLSFTDALTNKAVPNIKVIIQAETGEYLAEGYTDKNGLFATKMEVLAKKSSVLVFVSDASHTYADQKTTYYLGKSNELAFNSKLAPSEELYAKWYANDDSLYGGRFDGVIAKEYTIDSLDIVCDKDEFKLAKMAGEENALQNYISRNINYPQESIENNEQGRVYLEFIIEKNGAISHVRIMRGVSPLLDLEAYRLIKKMPKWIPAECNGEVVRSVGKIPISFTLN